MHQFYGEEMSGPDFPRLQAVAYFVGTHVSLPSSCGCRQNPVARVAGSTSTFPCCLSPGMLLVPGGAPELPATHPSPYTVHSRVWPKPAGEFLTQTVNTGSHIKPNCAGDTSSPETQSSG